MSLRFSADEAVELGIISKDEARAIRQAGKQRCTPTQERLRKAKASTSTKPKTMAARQLAAANDPQTILFNALCERLPAGTVEWEVPGLVEGRKFRVDILVGGSEQGGLVVEMDGFAYHKSKTAFQKDRERQNLLAANGYLVFRTFTKEVFDEQRRFELVELIASTYERLTLKREAGRIFES